LRAAAGPAQRDSLPDATAEAASHRRLRWVVNAAWLAAIALAVSIGREPAWAPWYLLGLLVFLLAPAGVALLLVRRPLVEAFRLGRLSITWLQVRRLLAIAVVLLSIPGAGWLDSVGVPFPWLLSAAALLVSLLIAPPWGVARRSAALNLAHLVLAREPARALALLEELERRVPGTFAVTMGRASALRRLGRAPEAWRAVEEALQRDPDKGAAQSLAARIAVGEGRIEEAEQRLQLAEQLDPGSPSHQICRAELEIAQGAMDRARSSLREARQVAARQPFAFAMLDDLEDLSARLGEAPAPA
jgi:hypothetical protein